MVEFAYNNVKNASIGYTSFELIRGYYLRASYKEDIDPWSQSKPVDKLVSELKKLIIIYRENLYHAQGLQKQYLNKVIKFRSYALDDKVWFNSKYIKSMQNQKLETKFFRLFWVLYLVSK